MLLPAAALGLLLAAPPPEKIGHHLPVYDAQGHLLPWTSWSDAIEREMQWFRKAPITDGYPAFVRMTFMDGNYQPITTAPSRRSFIPATQNGMGIISYLKYDAFTGRKLSWPVQTARFMGDYLVKESLTPDTGAYPRFSRSTGWRDVIPQPPDSGSQNDRPYEIEPDKGGIAGYALLLLWERTKDERYLNQALQNARVLVSNMRDGDARRSPWPFRVDYRTGASRGEVSGNMSFILRLFDGLIDHGYSEFAAPRARLWSWIKQHQIPNAGPRADGLLWVNFFEDHEEPDNRIAWSPLNLARYLLERREALDPDWREDARTLIEFTHRRFITINRGIAVCGEQDYDRNPWGGVVSTWGAVLALYSKATGSTEYLALAREALNYALYATDDDGCPGDGAWRTFRGGWMEDAHTDKLHNYLDAITAFPAWAR